MFNIYHCPPDLRSHMQCVAADALALADIAIRPDVPIVEQLNAHDHPYVRDAREAIVATAAMGEAVQLVLTDLTSEDKSCGVLDATA